MSGTNNYYVDAYPDSKGSVYLMNQRLRTVEKAALPLQNTETIATLATITSAYLNTKYPTLPIGAEVLFLNVTDQAGAYILVKRITATIWASFKPLNPL
jgi:hypothetical protein